MKNKSSKLSLERALVSELCKVIFVMTYLSFEVAYRNGEYVDHVRTLS